MFAAHRCLSEGTEFEGARHADRQQDRELKRRRHRQLVHEHEHLGHLGHDDSGLLMLERIRARINVVKSQLRLLQNSSKLSSSGHNLAAFKVFDKDGNGTLDVKELKDFIDVVKGKSIDKVVEMVTQADLDANGDGVITFDEFWAIQMKQEGYQDEDAYAKDFETRLMSVEDWEVAKEGFKAKLQAS